MRPPVPPSLRGFPRSLRDHYGVAPSGYKLSLPIPRRLPHRHLRQAYGGGALRSIVNPETSACFSELPMRCCCVPSFNRPDAILRATFLPPIEEEAVNILTPSATVVYRLRRRCYTQGQRGLFASGASSCFGSPLRPCQLRCTQPTNPFQGRSMCRVRRVCQGYFATPHEGTLRWRSSTPLPHTPEASSPGTFSFRRFRSTASPVSPLRAEQCRHNALRTLIIRPPQAPKHGAPLHKLHFGDVADRFTNSEQPPAHGAEGSADSQTAIGF